MPAQAVSRPGTDFAPGLVVSACINWNKPLEPGEPHIRFKAVTVRYGKRTALADFDLTINAGEALALLGPSGSGKTTILRALAGFTPIESGRIILKNADISSKSPQQRGFGIVVQNYAFFPHMSVADNVAFGLRARSVPRAEIQSVVAEYLTLVGMIDYAKCHPHELSGGQQQRIALARALAIRPDVLLMDEPLSALDAPLRREMLNELIRLHRQLPDLTMLFVTHDQSEALALADRVGLLREGRLLALDAPKNLYERPPNRFTAEFLGQTNLLKVEATAHPDGDGLVMVRLDSQTLMVKAPDGWDNRRNACWLCLRPHQVSLKPEGSEGARVNTLDCMVLAHEWKGSHYRVSVEVEGQPLHLEANVGLTPPQAGTRAALFFSPAAAWLLPRESSEGGESSGAGEARKAKEN
jgi:2-aminoethylphosphonate transport system ATP-binding protein